MLSHIHQLNQPNERVDMIHDRVFNRMQHSDCTVSTAPGLHWLQWWWHPSPTKNFTICRVTPWCSCSWRRFSSSLPLLSCASGTRARSLDSRAPRLLQTTQMPVLVGLFLWKKGFFLFLDCKTRRNITRVDVLRRISQTPSWCLICGHGQSLAEQFRNHLAKWHTTPTPHVFVRWKDMVPHEAKNYCQFLWTFIKSHYHWKAATLRTNQQIERAPDICRWALRFTENRCFVVFIVFIFIHQLDQMFLHRNDMPGFFSDVRVCWSIFPAQVRKTLLAGLWSYWLGGALWKEKADGRVVLSARAAQSQGVGGLWCLRVCCRQAAK